METFGDWLLERIEYKGWKQAELARRAHIQDATLSRIITGSRQVGPDVAQSIARALGVPPEQVFRKAGLLPATSAREEDIEEAVWILGKLSARKAGFLFTTMRGGPMERNALRRLLHRIGERAGVEGVNVHRFRHTFAIWFLRNGGNVFALQRVLGHSTMTMVQRYLAIAQTDVEDAHRQASPVANWLL